MSEFKVIVEAVTLESANFIELAKFYEEAFNLPKSTRTLDDHIGYHLDGCYFGIDLSKAEKVTGNATIWFLVEDIHASHKKLLELGAEAVAGPQKCGETEMLAWMKDIEGNRIGLISKLS